MHRHSCLTNLIVAEDLITGMTDQGDPEDLVYLNFSKAFDSVCHRLLVTKTVAMGIDLKITSWVEEFPKEQGMSSEIGRPHLKRRYLEKRRASGLCAWTPSVPNFYK